MTVIESIVRDLRDLPIPFRGQVRTSVVAAAPLPPLVVLGRTSSVVRSLLSEDSIVVHWPSLSLKIRTARDFGRSVERDYLGDSVHPQSARPNGQCPHRSLVHFVDDV